MPAAPKQVLELGGADSFVELPVEAFENLTEATVEGWVKREKLNKHSRFFDCGKKHTSICVKNSGTSPDTGFEGQMDEVWLWETVRT